MAVAAQAFPNRDVVVNIEALLCLGVDSLHGRVEQLVSLVDR